MTERRIQEGDDEGLGKMWIGSPALIFPLDDLLLHPFGDKPVSNRGGGNTPWVERTGDRGAG